MAHDKQIKRFEKKDVEQLSNKLLCENPLNINYTRTTSRLKYFNVDFAGTNQRP